jgi:hypothetical protein
MTISITIRKHIRQCANFAWEFCGIRETDTGGSLTIDHFQPKSKGGNDRLENLLYCLFAVTSTNVIIGQHPLMIHPCGILVVNPPRTTFSSLMMASSIL